MLFTDSFEGIQVGHGAAQVDRDDRSSMGGNQAFHALWRHAQDFRIDIREDRQGVDKKDSRRVATKVVAGTMTSSP